MQRRSLVGQPLLALDVRILATGRPARFLGAAELAELLVGFNFCLEFANHQFHVNRVIEETEATVAYGLRAARAGVDFLPARTFSGTDMLATVDYTIACLRGHAVACAKRPGTKKAGGP